MGLKVGDLVELNAAGKNRQWLQQAVDKIGVVLEVREPEPYANDWKCQSVSVQWSNLAPKRYYWSMSLNNKILPANCLKKIRRSKK